MGKRGRAENKGKGSIFFVDLSCTATSLVVEIFIAAAGDNARQPKKASKTTHTQAPRDTCACPHHPSTL
jgi:hypothetical protein